MDTKQDYQEGISRSEENLRITRNRIDELKTNLAFATPEGGEYKYITDQLALEVKDLAIIKETIADYKTKILTASSAKVVIKIEQKKPKRR